MDNPNKSSTFVGICIYVYTGIMAILFLVQVSNFVRKYQDEKVR